MTGLEHNVFTVALLWGSIVLFNLLIKWLAGFMLNTGLEPVGKAILNVAL